MARRTLQQRLDARSEPEPMTSCVLWTGYTAPSGYGQIGGPKKTVLYVHRVAYEAKHGPIPPGLVIDHVCRQRCCVNPDHLRAVTDRENLMAAGSLAVAKTRAEQTHCDRGHEFTAANTIIEHRKYGPRRRCRACNREWRRKRREEQRGSA